jgi:hypothetical protein
MTLREAAEALLGALSHWKLTAAVDEAQRNLRTALAALPVEEGTRPKVEAEPKWGEGLTLADLLAQFYREAWRDGNRNVLNSEPANEAREAVEYAFEEARSAAPRAPAEPPREKVAPQSTRTTPWSSACACSDYSRCVYHQEHPDEAPRAPSTTPPGCGHPMCACDNDTCTPPAPSTTETAAPHTEETK